MDVSPKLAEDFMKCLKNIWQSQEFADFTVTTEDVSFKCHRVILSACSHFFKCLLQTNMREAASGCVEVNNVSATTLELVLEMIYTGENLLTNENFLEVWRAVHQLQIDHLIKCCEEFALKELSIENFEDIYKHGHILNSSSVRDETTRFMLKEFSFVRKTKTFLQLSFEDLISLIKSQQLNISTEDIVLQSVLEWVDFVPKVDNVIIPLESNDTDQQKSKGNESLCAIQCSDQANQNNFNYGKLSLGEEKALKDKISECKDNTHDFSSNIIKMTSEIAKPIEHEKMFCVEHSTADDSTKDSFKIALRDNFLIELLKAVRVCLVSPIVLDMAFKHKLIAKEKKAREIIFNALKYHLFEFKHDQWPTAALHRDCSEFVNVGITAFGKGKFQAVSVVNEIWYDISECDDVRNGTGFQMTAAGDNIYFICNDNSRYPYRSKCVYMLKDKKWHTICQIYVKDNENILLSHGTFIYLLGKNSGTTYQFDPKHVTHKEFIKLPDGVALKHAMSYENNIIIYCAEKNENDVDETAVYVLDMESLVWTRLNNLNGPAEKLISFRNDENTFILQSNGSLWVIDGSLAETVRYKLIAQLWNFSKDLYGAITQGEKLYIVGNSNKADPADKIILTHLNGYFSRIKHVGRPGHDSNFIPAVLPKAELANKDK